MILIIVAGLLQSATWFTLAGVKSDLVMVLVLVMLMIDHDWLDRLALILLGELMLQFGPRPDIYSIIFLGLMVISALVIDLVSLQPYLTLGSVVVAATILMNVYGHIPWSIILTESAYNLVLAILFYTVLKRPYGQKISK
ncbi:MAG: hypothetical protein M1361_00120 [Patescibacteria group bacterium]|nr:hypothetical protein [Patescibacteria group bacterium]MCL5224025.1 hypothetical protein [Patescibacteria group bacterium]